MVRIDLQIREVRFPEDLQIVQKLLIDYLSWGNGQMQFHFGVHPHNPAQQVSEDIQNIDKFLPPHGRMLLAYKGNEVCGIGALDGIESKTGEIKRMYVDPSFRNLGVGKAILNTLLDFAKKEEYQKVRLNSPKFMQAAHSLYRSVEFYEIEVYPEVEIPEALRQYLLFMELEF
jgi:GNAT superfamily N-acetyltransferase